MFAALVFTGLVINWLGMRTEVLPPRAELSGLPTKLGTWNQKGSEILFDDAVNGILRTSDYTMREYSAPDGRIANIYVGYYASQRTGATYHSPQNCLPGAGWVLSDHQLIDIKTSAGSTITANRYTIENGIYRQVMIYWYQGRGQTEASEYSDKFRTIVDSITRSRSDGAMIRVMTTSGGDEQAAVRAVYDLASRLSEQLSPFIPE
jgi:EpsI family protein